MNWGFEVGFLVGSEIIIVEIGCVFCGSYGGDLECGLVVGGIIGWG